MNLKELKEQRSALALKMQGIVNACEAETTSLNETENVEFEEIRSQIADIDVKINEIKEEQRNQEPLDAVEKKEEERGNTMEKTFEMEKRAIEAYLKNDVNSEELRAVDTSNNGALVPTHLHSEIVKKLEETGNLFVKTRQFAPVGGKLDILREDNIGAGAWIGEGEEAEAVDFSVKKVTLDGHRATATVQLSQSLLNSNGVDVSSYALDILIRRLAAVLNKAVVSGKGASQDQPEGILMAPADCHVKSASKSAIDMDDIIDLYNSINPEYLADSVFVVGRKEFNKLAKLKNADGSFYLQRDLVNGGSAYRILGIPVVVSDEMPENTGAGNEKLVALVNLERAMASLIAKGIELKTVSHDSKTALGGNILMVMDCYVDSKLINNDACRILVTPEA